MSTFENAERMSRDEMVAVQSERLRAQVRHAYERIPFYRDALDARGVRPEDVRSIEDVRLLPFTKKADISAHYPNGLLAVDRRETVRVHSSSGTTGKPINVFYTRRDLDNWIGCAGRLLRIAGVESSDVCQIAFRYSLFTGAFGHHRGAESVGATVIPTSSGQTERQIVMMQDLGTTVLHCTPSYAVVIAEKLEELGLKKGDLSLRLGIHGAEPMSDPLRDEIQDRLGIRVARDYGLTELGGPGVSIECPHQSGYHLNEDFFYPEIIDPESGEPLPEGSRGELVFTSLAKEASPLLRYRTRDISFLTTEPCACGRTLARHGPILGRSDDMLIIGGVNFFPSQVEAVLLAFDEAAPHYLIRLREENRRTQVAVEVEAEPAFWAARTERSLADAKKRIEARLKDLIGFRIDVTLVPPQTVARSEGKAKRVVDERR
ncbi:MAG: phenylacetate--CoA ligase [Deltaproteobacteria bacterium]|nr:phenylacetate--CoA ligase [Deltaproteobacteria bacterium]